MGLADTVTKAYMKENTVFADAFNYLIYGGKTVVNPTQLKELDTTEIALPFGAQDENGNQPDDAVQKYRDVLKSAVIKQDGLKLAQTLVYLAQNNIYVSTVVCHCFWCKDKHFYPHALLPDIS